MLQNRFTVRIRPYAGESLFSFMLRFAQGNGIDFLILWNMIQEEKNHFTQLADIGVLNFAPVNMIEPLKMSYMTGLDTEEIMKMTFYYLLKKFCGNGDIERSRFTSEMLRDTFHYCPMCLQENSYHRLLWSVRDINICFRHNSMIASKCLHCNQEIKLKEIKEFSICPYCGSKVWEGEQVNTLDESEFRRQSWLHDAFNKLIMDSNTNIVPHDIATRILFVLNKERSTFDRELVKNSLNGRKHLATLLQHSRESLSTKRTLHLSFILSVLHENNIDIDKFLNIQVPHDFIVSVRNKLGLKKDEVCCMAPWCKNYMIKGALVKTGTSFKRRNDNSVFKYYLICPECGCEYAFDENNELKERTYFIKSYFLFKKFSNQELGIKRLSEKTGLSQETIKRCLSYFQSRGMFIGEYNRKTYEVDELLLHKFINAVKCGTSINQIKKWPIWDGYNHFLFYRFQKDVAKEINIHSYQGYKKQSKIINDRQVFVKNILEKMLKQGIDVTINNVCKEANVCPETIRYWKCNSLIAKIKEQQRNEKIFKLKNSAQAKVDNYLLENDDSAITSDGLYSYIGIGRTILWRHWPELTAYIGQVLKEHNKRLHTKV